MRPPDESGTAGRRRVPRLHLASGRSVYSWWMVHSCSVAAAHACRGRVGRMERAAGVRGARPRGPAHVGHVLVRVAGVAHAALCPSKETTAGPIGCHQRSSRSLVNASPTCCRSAGVKSGRPVATSPRHWKISASCAHAGQDRMGRSRPRLNTLSHRVMKAKRRRGHRALLRTSPTSPVRASSRLRGVWNCCQSRAVANC